MSKEPTPPIPIARSARATKPVPPAQPPAHKLLAIIRFLGDSTENVIFGFHAQERMEERGITDADVLAVLRQGVLKGPISPGINDGEWKCKIVAKPRGSRQIGVVTIIMVGQHLFVKTVEWEDK